MMRRARQHVSIVVWLAAAVVAVGFVDPDEALAQQGAVEPSAAGAAGVVVAGSGAEVLPAGEAGTPIVQSRPGRAWYYGARGGLYSSAGAAFLGGEVFVSVADRVSVNPNVEWVFVQDVDRIATFNIDVVYDFPLQATNFYWAGAGVGVRHFAKGGGWPVEHNLALNLLGGFGFGRGAEYMPFVQGKLAISDVTEFVLTAGFRF